MIYLSTNTRLLAWALLQIDIDRATPRARAAGHARTMGTKGRARVSVAASEADWSKRIREMQYADYEDHTVGS